ncbi:MAG TPA: phosphoribosylglycinamide formyltransferase, partial [Gammaproteobacteria bacterium]|nr:phosphoribosylglycinamide formyltransferase [Gammaproteobacteria bacterium]
MKLPIVILLSGNGSNLQKLIDASTADLPIRICAVISNNPNAYGLERARKAGIRALVVDHRSYDDRPAFECALQKAVDVFTPRLLVLAGFMRILGAEFVRHYPLRLINIHPSLLPRFRGLHTHERALSGGVSTHG